jgi:hypothetical protein
VAASVSVPLQPSSLLVPVHQYDLAPSYYIFAGLVFVPLTQPFLHEWGTTLLSAPVVVHVIAVRLTSQSLIVMLVVCARGPCGAGEEWYNACPRKLCDRAMNGEKMEPDQQVVVLSHGMHARGPLHHPRV